MKIPTILAVLAAIALANPIQAAPTAASPSDVVVPAINGTFTDDDGADLLSRVVKYNYEADAELAALYDEAMSSEILPLSNGAAKKPAAAAVKSDVLPYCVGLATDGPVRVRIFRNKMTCDGNGFATLWTFTGHSKKDDIMASKPMCIALSTNAPTRSLFALEKTACNVGGFKTDFVYYQSTRIHSPNDIWMASDPVRMLMYPYYDGFAHDWPGFFTGMTTLNFFRLASNAESRTLRTDFKSHLAVLKKIKVSSPPDVATARCAELLVDSNPADGIPPKDGYTVSGKHLLDYSYFAFNAKCNHLVSSSNVVVRRVYINGFGSIELNIGKTTVAAVSMKVRHGVPPIHISRVLLESLRTAQPIMIGVNDHFPSHGVTAYVQGKMIALSLFPEYWTATI